MAGKTAGTGSPKNACLFSNTDGKQTDILIVTSFTTSGVLSWKFLGKKGLSRITVRLKDYRVLPTHLRIRLNRESHIQIS